MDYFSQCSCLETNPCVLCFTISLTLEEAVTAAEFGTYFPDFTFRYRLKNLWMGCIKQVCSLIRGMVENYCTLSKIQPCLLFTSALRDLVNSRPRLNFTLGTIISTIPLMSSQYFYTISMSTVCFTQHGQKVDWVSFGKNTLREVRNFCDVLWFNNKIILDSTWYVAEWCMTIKPEPLVMRLGWMFSSKILAIPPL